MYKAQTKRGVNTSPWYLKTNRQLGTRGGGPLAFRAWHVPHAHRSPRTAWPEPSQPRRPTEGIAPTWPPGAQTCPRSKVPALTFLAGPWSLGAEVYPGQIPRSHLWTFVAPPKLASVFVQVKSFVFLISGRRVITLRFEAERNTHSHFGTAPICVSTQKFVDQGLQNPSIERGYP